MLNVDKPLRFFFAAGMGIGPTSLSSESSSTVELTLVRFPRTDVSGASGESDMDGLQVSGGGGGSLGTSRTRDRRPPTACPGRLGC
jgi:hypothetical protein